MTGWPPGSAAPMQTEVFPLALFAIAGMMVFPAATDAGTLFVALEVLSLPLYLLCGLGRRRRLILQESAMKYFLLALHLGDLCLRVGPAVRIRRVDLVRPIAAQARAGDSSDVLLIGGLALVVVGLLFKASVGPFHLWTPGRLPGRAHAGDRVHGVLHQGGGLRGDAAHLPGGVRADVLDLAAGAGSDRRARRW